VCEEFFIEPRVIDRLFLFCLVPIALHLATLRFDRDISSELGRHSFAREVACVKSLVGSSSGYFGPLASRIEIEIRKILGGAAAFWIGVVLYRFGSCGGRFWAQRWGRFAD
jgi:hypothetical protein